MAIDIGNALSRGWESVKANPVPAILGMFIATVISQAVGLIPYCGGFISLFINPAFEGGMWLLALNLIRDRHPEIGDVFKGFSDKYVEYLLFYLLLAGITLALLILPLGLIIAGVIFLDPHQHAQPVGVALLVAGGILALIAIVILYFILLRWIFTPAVIADDWSQGSIGTALKRSSQITLGNRLMLFLSLIVIGIIGMAGILACCVGVFVTMPIARCALAAIYDDLKAQYLQNHPEDAPPDAFPDAAPDAAPVLLPVEPR